MNTNVIVIGGGYAGVSAANRLTKRDDVTVTLINPRSTFVERIRLHQLVAGTDDAVVDYRDVLSDKIKLVVDSVARINVDDRSVTLSDGGHISYDYLVYAVGSSSAAPRVPGASEFTYPVSTLEEAQRLRSALEAVPAAAPVVVVGAGASGIETASELAEAGRAVTLVGSLESYLHNRSRASVAKHLARLGVTVLDGAAVTAVTADAVTLGDGREVASAVTIWTAGFGVPDLARRSGLRTDTAGRLLTDETLTSFSDSRIVATGDAVAPSNLPFRMSCQAATQLGPAAGDTVLSWIAGDRPAAVSVALAALCLSLGRDAGIFQISRRDDTATRYFIGGRMGAKVKERICSGIVKHLSDEAQKPGSLSYPGWVTKNKSRQRLLAEYVESPVGSS